MAIVLNKGVNYRPFTAIDTTVKMTHPSKSIQQYLAKCSSLSIAADEIKYRREEIN
jgi:hypothetical protein